MCGILGRLGTVPPSGRIHDALELLRHRGPDSAGSFADGELELVMRRLAIIDLETGDQPISNEDGSVTVVCNGELYNYVELRDELRGRGHRFSTGSDVEVAVHLYEEEGEAGFARLRGMFALALWDAPRRRLVLARDRFGIKPLYLAELDGSLLFASEIAPLLELGVRRDPDLEAVADVLSLGYVTGERTGFAAVQSLRPGHALVRERGRTHEVRFATLEPRALALEPTLAEAVRLQLRSDVPLAVLLSGGLDSSLIAALAADVQPGLHTFTVGFGDASFDELEPARAVAAAIGAHHHEIAVTADAASDLPAIARRLEEPNGDSSAIPLYYLCRAVAEEVKVALAGEGGDEVFGGYARYAWDSRARLLGRLLPTAAAAQALLRIPAVRRRAAGRARGDAVRRAVKLLRHAGLPDAERYFSWFALVSDDAGAELLGREPSGAVEAFRRAFAEAPTSPGRLARLQYVDLRTMLAKDLLVKADRMSMAHSLELRVPMLDEQVVAAGFALGDAEKVRGVRTKVAIRQLVDRRLGARIARRPKQGFEVPIDRWLREDLAPLAKELLSREHVSRHGLLRPEAVERRLAEHLRGDADHGLSLYGLIMLELWYDELVAAPRPRVAA